MECWYYEKECFSEIKEDYIGFVYKITVLPSDHIPKELWGKFYIGKKVFNHNTKKRISKKQIQATKTRKRIVRGIKDSGWLKYFGSCKSLTEDISLYGIEHFHREIICFCETKTSLSYKEAYYQFLYRVLELPSYNGWIKITSYKATLNK